MGRGGAIARRAVLLLVLALLASAGPVASATRTAATGSRAGGAVVADSHSAIDLVSDTASKDASSGIHVPTGALPADVSPAIIAPDAPQLDLFPGLPALSVSPAQPLARDALLRISYSDEFLRDYHVVDPRSLVLYARGDDGLWSIVPSVVLADEHAVVASVDRLTTWAVTPAGLLGPWQGRAIIGQPLAAGARNVVVLHGWNSSPWDGCMYRLIGALSGDYDHVAAYVYPSALDIASNAGWLRDEVAREYPGVAFDVVAFSEGGLVARAAIEPGAWNGGRTLAGVRRLITIATPHEGLVPGILPSVLGDVAAAQMHAGSPFLRALDAGPEQGPTRYYLIAGDGARDGRSDGLVPVESALGRGVLNAAATATLPLVHAPAYGGAAAMPCDTAVYAQIAAWVRR